MHCACGCAQSTAELVAAGGVKGSGWGMEADGAVEDRIQQMALRIKEKDNELTRKQIVLEDKLAKCDECEARLATWQQELEGFAAAMGSSGGDVE